MPPPPPQRVRTHRVRGQEGREPATNVPRANAAQPTGTVTFLFTDIEGSTSLLQALGDDRAAQVFEEHHRLLRAAFSSCGGHVIETQGDAFLVGFQSARDAMLCGVEGQRALHDHPWPKDAELRVRMGLNTAEAVSASGGYVSLGIHRTARICSIGWGGQILVSGITLREAIGVPLPLTFRDHVDRSLSALKARLDPDHFAAALSAGRGMPAERAVELALESPQLTA